MTSFVSGKTRDFTLHKILKICLFIGSEVLEIENVTFVDEGFYACVVGNEVANVKAGAYLTVEDPKIVPMNPQSQKPLVFVSY